MTYTKISLYLANGIPEALSNLWYGSDSAVVEIRDAVEDAKNGKDLLNRIQKMKLLRKFTLDRENDNVIHYGFIEKVIEELGKTYHILEIAFDRWGAVQMTQNLEGMGFTVVPFGQGFKDMSPPTKEFYKLLMEGGIIHGGNPVMAWMAGNVVVDTDPAGNIKPTKAKSPEKIDGIVAAIMALDRCIRNEGQQQGSVYDERDMIVF